MYEEFYGLRERAFALTPDPRFLLLTPGHQEMLSLVRYAMTGRAGLTLLIGEAGSGKTALLHAALGEPSRGAGGQSVLLDNPRLERDEFFEFLAEGFRLGRAATTSKTRLLRELRQVLEERQRRGRTSVLVVDEAQGLSDELLEEIRLLANLESRSAKLLAIILAGLPVLAERLDDPALGPLRQRIELRGVLAPLGLAETADYIAGRLRIAGGEIADTFTLAAVEAVFEASGGIPRTISIICESALVTGYAAAARPIDRDVVAEVCRDLDHPLADVPAPAPGPRAEAVGAPWASAERAKATGTTHMPLAAGATGEAAGEPSADVESPIAFPARPTVQALGRRVLDVLPFSRPRDESPPRLQVQSFQVGSAQGFVVTPAGRRDR